MNEFEFIKNIKKKYGLSHVGDDCAVLPRDSETDLLISTDLLVEDIDFRIEWITPELLGHKALAVSLSDIAAMGGTAEFALVSVGIPEPLWSSKFLDRFYEGWHELAGSFDVVLAGGDISRTPNKLVIDSIAGGSAARGRSILRTGANVGDAIYVTGPLGAAAAGLRLLNEGKRLRPDAAGPETNLIERQLKPRPRLEAGRALAATGHVTSMLDLSDGLSSDLAQICRASSVGAVINADDLPFEAAVLDVAGSVDAMLDLVLNGGEDFELLFTADASQFSETAIDGLFRIGEITSETGLIELVREGKREVLPPGGYRHF